MNRMMQERGRFCINFTIILYLKAYPLPIKLNKLAVVKLAHFARHREKIKIAIGY